MDAPEPWGLSVPNLELRDDLGFPVGSGHNPAPSNGSPSLFQEEKYFSHFPPNFSSLGTLLFPLHLGSTSFQPLKFIQVGSHPPSHISLRAVGTPTMMTLSPPNPGIYKTKFLFFPLFLVKSGAVPAVPPPISPSCHAKKCSETLTCRDLKLSPKIPAR